MRFLFINQYYAPDYAATAQQLSDICEQLVRDNHEVHVLTSRAIYDGRNLQLPSYEVLNGVKVHRLSICNSSRKRLRDRFFGYLSFYAKAFLKVHSIPKPDVVVTLTTPPLISILGTYLRLLKGSRFVYWVMDVYPDIAVKANVLPRWFPANLMTKAWAFFGFLSYKTANKIVVLGHDMKRTLINKGISEDKLHVIQSWACSKEVFPINPEHNNFRQESLSTDQFNLMYSGNMGTCHTFTDVIKVAKSFTSTDRILFSFIGGGKQQALLMNELGNHKHVQFLPYQDRTKLSQSLSAPDAHLITLEPMYDGLLVPSKLYAIMAASRPIVFVGSQDNEVARIIKAADCGVIIEPGQSEQLATALKTLASDPDLCRRLGENGYKHFLKHFDKSILVNKLGNLLQLQALEPGIRGPRKLSHRTITIQSSRASDSLNEMIAFKHK
ncbi:MAG: glycosyltransferase family 4 protein [Sumerlaeia bacterium]